MKDDEDEVRRLVDRAKNGDHLAVGALYDRYADRLYRFARFRMPDPRDAEDLVQRVFLKMIEALPRYQSRGTPFGAWLFRIARNAVIDQHRTRRVNEPLEAAGHHATTIRGPEDLAVTATELDALASALRQLTDTQREVIAYRFFAGLSPREIGKVMGKREGSIRTLQFRALHTLRRQLSDEIADPGSATDEAAE
jgi:RNA polymerase sigma-70 factor (ECF subfamily)